MTPDSFSGQVISLSHKHLVQEIPHAGSVPVPGAGDAVLRDVLTAGPFDAAVTGFVLSCLPGAGTLPVLWIQDRMSRCENGRLYGAALPGFGVRGPILRVEVSHPRDVLWAMEEGAACAGLGAVVGEIHGAPEVLSFTATKRLALRSEAAQVPVWLIRSGDPGTLSAARERWRIGSAPSQVHAYNPHAPGPALWEAELFRARGRSPGVWMAGYDGRGRDERGRDERGREERGYDGADRLRLFPGPGDGPLAADHGAAADVAG